MKISYNSRTNGIFSFNGEGSTETNGGDRPKRPNSEDTQEGDVYTIIFEAKGKFIKTYIDGKLLVETKIKPIETGVSVLAIGIRRYLRLY